MKKQPINPVRPAKRFGILLLVIALMLSVTGILPASAESRWPLLDTLAELTGSSFPDSAAQLVRKDLHRETVNNVEITVLEAAYDGRTLFLQYSFRLPDVNTPLGITAAEVFGEELPEDMSPDTYVYGLADEAEELLYNHGVGWWTDDFWINGKAVGEMPDDSGQYLTGTGVPGEIIETDIWRLDNADLFLEGKVQISLPIGEYQEVPELPEDWFEAEEEEELPEDEEFPEDEEEFAEDEDFPEEEEEFTEDEELPEEEEFPEEDSEEEELAEDDEFTEEDTEEEFAEEEESPDEAEPAEREIPEGYDADGKLKLPEKGVVTFEFDTGNVLSSVRLFRSEQEIQLPPASVVVRETAFTPMMTYIELDYSVKPEALAAFVAENGEGPTDDQGNVMWSYGGMDVLGLWLESLQLTDENGTALFPDYYGPSAYSDDEAEFLFPYMETVPAQLYLAPVDDDGEADMDAAVRILPAA